MRCILLGHTERRMKGAGQFAGQEFLVCIHCNRTRPADDPLDQVAGCFDKDIGDATA